MLETVKEEVLEKVRKRFENDRFAMDNGAVIEAVGEGYARCVMSLDEHHYNAVGSVITYLGRAKGKKLIAEAEKVKEGRTTCYYLIEVADELGNKVAHVTSNGFSAG